MSRRSKLSKSMDTLFPQQHPDKCRVCNEPTVDGRWNYCSEYCRRVARAVQRMFVWSEVRERVLDRDDHTCQSCGLSRAMAKRAYWQIDERIKELKRPLHPAKSDHSGADMDRWRRAGRELHERYGRPDFTGGAFQVDHIDRVTDGGHAFDPTNLQTLCRECHEEKTAEENSVGSDDRPEIGLGAFIDGGGS